MVVLLNRLEQKGRAIYTMNNLADQKTSGQYSKDCISNLEEQDIAHRSVDSFHKALVEVEADASNGEQMGRATNVLETAKVPIKDCHTFAQQLRGLGTNLMVLMGTTSTLSLMRRQEFLVKE